MLNAAYTLLLRDGPTGLSMDALADLASVSKPTIYTHFGSKAELCRALVEDLASELVTGVAECEFAGASGSERVKRIARACLAVMADSRCIALYRVLVAEGPRDPTLREILVNAALAPTERLVMLAFDDMIAQGMLRVPSSELAVHAFFGLIKGRWLVPVLTGVRPPLTGEEVEQIAALTASVLAFDAERT